jgi:hypothetical protein
MHQCTEDRRTGRMSDELLYSLGDGATHKLPMELEQVDLLRLQSSTSF